MPEQIACNRDIAISNSDTLSVASDSTVRIGHNCGHHAEGSGKINAKASGEMVLKGSKLTPN